MATCDEEESLTERQENELQALKAIYFDVKDLRENDAWGVTRPPEIQITLFPLESMGGTKAHVSIDLLVKCSPTYPDVVPELQLDNAKGISTQQLEALGEELRSMAQERVGEVMLLELCQHVQSCLHAHNKAPKSFYEEMMLNQRREQKRAAQEQQRHNELQSRREQKQLQEIEEEIQRRDEAQKEETRRRREGMNKTTSEPVTSELDSPPMESHQRVPLSPQRSMNGDGGRRQERRSASLERRPSTPLCGQGDERTCDLHTGTTTLTFNTKRERSVYRGKCLGHSDQGSTTYTAMDTHSGELLAVSEWTLQWQKRWSEPAEIASYMKQVTSIEQELLSLLRLRHTHLVHYHALHCQQDHDSITVYVLMDYVGGGSLGRCLVQAEPVPMPLLRHYTCQLLEAFSYLHDKAVVHKDLRASSVLLDSSGNIRLADYSLKKRFSDLVARFQRHIALNSQHAPVIARGSKKGDVYSLGVVLLSLCQGHSVADLVVDLPTNLPRDFHDFLSMCLIRDERSRWSMQQLLDHSFVKMPLLLTVTMTTKGSGASLDRKQEGSLEEDEEGSVNIPFIPSTDSGSRLQNEFEILKFIGKGGFGDVIKVRNKLDTRVYAIKRIPLNPGNKTFTKKITREVKLLSQLNHENVVRYINSWIETSNDPVLSDSTSTSTATSDLSAVHPKIQHIINPTMHQNSLGLRDDIEKFAPAPIVEGSIEWSVSADIVGSHGNNEESSSEEEDDIKDVFGRSFLPFLDSDDDGIEFQSDSVDEGKNKKEVEESEVSIERRHEGETPDSVPKLQFLYIQMEFCEKSTLRTCIDTGLYEDMGRVWRLFREVVDGLVHIHEQGIIHRDLKPVNIFLDLNDQVKIGDFGLATTDIISRLGPPSGVLEVSFSSDTQVSMSRSGSVGDGNLTGKVGTALYVSPEMMDTTAKAHYDQKVDIYSLGVIFFEMCTPMATGMERVKVLSALRLPSIDFPPEFDEVELEQQVKMIRWLLNHDPGLRPTSLELLQSKLLPPPQLQEAELNEVLRSTISNPDSKSYKHMVAAMFSQDPVPAKDFVYDNDFYKSAFCSTMPLLQRYVTDTVEGIFRKHGAVQLSTPLLVPQSSVYDRCESYVCVMARHGSLITLPYDLRIHFARYLAHSNVTQLKRYSIERVYREAPLLGAHPRELMACAFDIVTPSPAGLVPDAEVLHVAWELVAEFPVLQARNYYVRMNHTALLRAVLIYSGVSEELRHDVCAILGDNKAEKQKKLQIKTRLQGLSLSVHTVETLYNFIEAEDVFSRVASMLRCITKTNGPAAAYAKKGLHEMEALVGHMESLGVKWRVVLAPGLVYNAHHFSGVVFQVVSNVQRKKKTVMEVLAAGGRYDHLINEFRKSRNAPSFQCAVGISVSYDRMVAALQEQKDFVPPTRTDVLVCTLGHRMLLKEKLSLVKDLWSVGLCADIAHDATWSLEELQAYCRTSGILYIVLLKDLESGTVRVRSLERDKYIEKKVNLAEVADYLQQRLQTLKWETTESGQNSTGKMPNVPGQGSSEPPSHVGNTSKNLPQFTMTFLQSDNTKLSKNTKRTYESQIYSAVSSALVHISQRALVEILGLDLNGDVLKTIAAYLELDDDEAVFEKSLSSIIEKHLRYRKYLTKIFDYIHEQKYAKSCSVFVIFGLKDNSYKVLM